MGLCPKPHWGAYGTPPYLLAAIRGPTSKARRGGRELKGEGMEGRERERGKRRGNGEGVWPAHFSDASAASE